MLGSEDGDGSWGGSSVLWQAAANWSSSPGSTSYDVDDEGNGGFPVGRTGTMDMTHSVVLLG